MFVFIPVFYCIQCDYVYVRSMHSHTYVWDIWEQSGQQLCTMYSHVASIWLQMLLLNVKQILTFYIYYKMYTSHRMDTRVCMTFFLYANYTWFTSWHWQKSFMFAFATFFSFAHQHDHIYIYDILSFRSPLCLSVMNIEHRSGNFQWSVALHSTASIVATPPIHC